MSLDGLLNWLKQRDLNRPTIGRIHEVLHGNDWVEVNMIGFYTWIEEEQLALFGQLVPDEVMGKLMAKVLEDKHYAEEHGKLPK